MLRDPELFVIVLIDEIESLSATRDRATDQEAIRLVNSLLTSLDSLKERDNCVCLATSNLSECIDPAFRDRADLVQFIGLPEKGAAAAMINQSIQELVRVGLVQGLSPCKIQEVAGIAVEKQLSGRALRKLPFITMVDIHALYGEHDGTVEESLLFSSFLRVLEKDLGPDLGGNSNGARATVSGV